MRVGPMLREDEAVRLEHWIRDAAPPGGHLLTRGGRNRAVFEPAIVADVQAICGSRSTNCSDPPWD